MEIPLLKPDAKEQSLNVCEVRRRMRLCCKDRCPPHLLLELQVSQKCESEVIQSCLTLCNPMDCSLPGSPIHGIFQARVLEWVAISFSRGSFWPRNWIQVSHIAGRCFYLWAFVLLLEKTLESPSDCKEIQPVHPKGKQFRIFIEKTDVEAETPILWPPDAKNRLIRKHSDAEKIEGRRRRGRQRMRWLDGIAD